MLEDEKGRSVFVSHLEELGRRDGRLLRLALVIEFKEGRRPSLYEYLEEDEVKAGLSSVEQAPGLDVKDSYLQMWLDGGED